MLHVCIVLGITRENMQKYKPLNHSIDDQKHLNRWKDWKRKRNRYFGCYLCYVVSWLHIVWL